MMFFSLLFLAQIPGAPSGEDLESPTKLLAWVIGFILVMAGLALGYVEKKSGERSAKNETRIGALETKSEAQTQSLMENQRELGKLEGKVSAVETRADGLRTSIANCSQGDNCPLKQK